MHAFDKIIPLLSENLQQYGSAILLGSSGRIPIKKDAFQEITPETGNAVFIDAGNGEVLAGPNLSLQFIRLHSVSYEKNVRVDRSIKEFYLLVVGKKKDLDLGFEATLFDSGGNEIKKFNFDAFDPALSFAGRRAEPSAVVNYVRKLLEISLCQESCNESPPNTVLVRDGDLEARGELLEKALHSLRIMAEKKKVVVLGLSKTSTLCTDSGNSALAALRSIEPSGVWSYYAGNNVAFLKLHPGAKYIFRCDVFNHDRDKLTNAFAVLASNAVDPTFLGYPYGLLDADKFAQVTKSETAELKARFSIKSKDLFSQYEHAIDAHDILDSL